MATISSPVLRDAFSACRPHLLAAAGFSLAMNLLNLAIPIYSIQLYDRVMLSGSGATLAAISLAVVIALITSAVLDNARTRILVFMGLRFDNQLSARVVGLQLEHAAEPSSSSRGQTLRDVDMLRQTFSGSGTLAVLDFPWTPIYLGVCLLIHPALGIVALGGSVALMILAVMNQAAVSKPLEDSAKAAQASYAHTESMLRNAEAILAMGMHGDMMRRWQKTRATFMGQQARASNRNATIGSLIRFFRLGLQVVIMGAGAWLVVEREMSAGGMFAAMLLTTRALMPIDQIVAAWPQIAGAWAALKRINGVLESSSRPVAMRLPAPKGLLSVENVSFRAPGSDNLILRNVSFALAPGEALGLVGPSAAGKTSLARLLTGAAKPTAGAVRLDGGDLYTWDRDDVGRWVGYLPQDIEIFGGKIGENIGRFRDNDPAAIVEAARKAGIHDMILRMPQGYETQVGEGGAFLSGGQRQRIGIARAIYGNPRLVILDEPNSNLDGEGEEALRQLLAQLKQDGTTVVIIAHRPSVMTSVDKLLVLKGGAVAQFGPAQQVVGSITPQAQAVQPMLKEQRA